LKSSDGYGEKLGYKLPHTVKNRSNETPPIQKDVYAKQEEQFK